MNAIDFSQLATIGGLSGFIMVMLGLFIKNPLKVWKGDDWPWYGPVLNGAAALFGVVGGMVAFGLIGGWEAANLVNGFLTGVFAAASSVGLYEFARARVPSNN